VQQYLLLLVPGWCTLRGTWEGDNAEGLAVQLGLWGRQHHHQQWAQRYNQVRLCACSWGHAGSALAVSWEALLHMYGTAPAAALLLQEMASRFVPRPLERLLAVVTALLHRWVPTGELLW